MLLRPLRRDATHALLRAGHRHTTARFQKRAPMSHTWSERSSSGTASLHRPSSSCTWEGGTGAEGGPALGYMARRLAGAAAARRAL